MNSGTCFHFGFFSVILVTCVVTGTGLVIDCYTTTADDYNGHQQTTKNGTPCIRWDSYDKKVYRNEQFHDVTVSDATNFCRAVGKDYLWCWTSNRGDWDTCGIEKCDNNGISKCGNLKIKQPALVGRNVTFTFTPDSHDQDAILEWQRATETKRYTWYTRPLTYKFIQYNENGTYYMVLTNSVPKGDELYYRIHYFNESMHCWMEAGKLDLDDRHNNPCGFVYLRKKCVLKDENVYLEYYPSKDVMENPDSFERQWVRSKNRSASYINIKLGADIYFEDKKENGMYTLTVSMANSRMIGHYGVYCGKEAGFTNNVSVAVQVPPSDIKIEIKFYSIDPLRMYAVCTLKNSNPVCRANFTASNDIIGSEKNSSSMCLPHGVWKTEFVVNLNVSEEDNGKDVTCAAECADFQDLELRDSKTIKLPYRPDIKFNISGPMLNISKGERAGVKCIANSVPASKISWIEKSDKEDKIKKQCDYEQECVLDVNADAISKQNFVCAIRYLQLSDNKTLIVNIYKSRKQGQMSNNGNGTLIGIIVGLCSALVVIVAVMVIVIRSNRNNDQAKHKRDQPSQEGNSLLLRENEHVVPGNDVGLADDQLDVKCSQPVKKKRVTTVCNETYAEVDKTSNRTQLGKCSTTEGKRSEDGQLMYVDLEFNADEKMPKKPVVKRRDSPTEYVAIDFAKTAAYIAEENEAIEIDSIYANQ